MGRDSMKIFHKKIFCLSCILSLCYLSTSCDGGGSVGSEPASYDFSITNFVSECQTPGSVQDVTFQGSEEAVTSSEQGVLDCQVDYSDASLALDDEESSRGLSLATNSGSGPQFLSMRFTASVAAPLVDGVALAASDVFFNGNQAIVTYNTAGSNYRGAVQTVDVTDPNRPRLLSEIVFKNVDVSTGVINDGALFLAEAQDTSQTGFSTPAQAQRIDLSSNLLPSLFNDPVSLPSYVGTDVLASGNNLYVTTGDTGGIVLLSKLSMAQGGYIPLSDARSLDINPSNGFIYVYRGAPTGGSVSVVNTNDFSLTTSYVVGGGTIPESKGTIQFLNGYLFIGAGDGGVLIVDPSTQQVVATVSNPSLVGLAPSLQVSNAVKVGEDNVMFISNGEAGIRAASYLNSSGAISPRVLGTLAFPSQVSANGISYRNDFLMVASGTAGLKIVKVNTSPYLVPLNCSSVTSVFCDDFARFSNGQTINDDIIWSGKNKVPKVSATAISQGANIISKEYINTVSSFSHASSGKHYSVKAYQAGVFSVIQPKSRDVGVQMTYDGGSKVTAYVGAISNVNKRYTLNFQFPQGQEFVVLHVYEQGALVKVAIELPDGTVSSSENLTTLFDLSILGNNIINLAPNESVSTLSSLPTFDDVWVQNYSF